VKTLAFVVGLVPTGVVTTTLRAPEDSAGEVAVILVDDTTVNRVAATDPNTTFVAPVKPDPEIVTDVPPRLEPLDGDRPVITGAALYV